MPHNHTPPPPRDHDAAYRHRRALLWALALTASVMIIEFIVGINIGSLALLADAAHMATDTTALLLAALTAHATTRPSPAHRSFGLLRLEVLTATINALLLTGLCITIVAEAITRIGSPTTIPPHTLLVTATIGLLINLISWRILHPSAQQSINVNAARLEVLADLIGSVTVILTALLLTWTGWWWLDSLAAISLAVLIIPRTAHILRDTIRILLEAAPRTTSIPDLTAALATLPGVRQVHDVHVWTITTGVTSASAHLLTAPGTPHATLLPQALQLLSHRYAIDHATIQIEESRRVCHGTPSLPCTPAQ